MLYRVMGVLLALLVALIGLIIGAAAGPVFGFAACGLAIWLGLRSWKTTAQGIRDYPSDLAAYERKWSCLRCGYSGDLDDFSRIV
jgi:hypothetical protein